MRFGAADDGYRPGRRDDVGILLTISALGVGLAGLGQALFVKPTPPQPAAELHGCFTAPAAPSLFFDGRLLRIGQPELPPTRYRLQWAKSMLVDVVTDAPLSLLPIGSRYIFERGEQRTIVFARLMYDVDGKGYGVGRVADARYLSALTPGGDDVRYDPAPPDACRPRPRG